MTDPKILSLIKTECGRSKYIELVKRDGLKAKIRLLWFVVFAIIKDINVRK